MAIILDGFYTIVAIKKTDEGLTATVELNKDHRIFKAHFPDHPIIPGVCILQIVQELLERHLEKPLRMIGARNIKFLNVLSPNEYSMVDFKVAYAQNEAAIRATTQVSNQDTLFTKLSTEYTVEF
jgi:FabA-like domain.